MRRSIRRELRLMRAYCAASACAFAYLAVIAMAQPGPQKFGEISVERLNVVDANGTLRMVISNKDRMHPGIIDGRLIDRPRPVAGMLFFNDRGDEVGGLTYTGQERDGQASANAGIMFDQWKQDQTIGIAYSETNGRRRAGLQVWDRPDRSLGELVDQLNAANKITDAAAKEAAIKKIRAEAPPAPQRVFVGKNTDKAAIVTLADGNGKPRLTLKVDAGGEASIEFLDEGGKVVRRLPESSGK